MWLRNGNSAFQLAINYALPPLCRSLRDLDILLVQFSAAGGTTGLGAEALFDLMVERFSLQGYAQDLVSKGSLMEGWTSPPRLQDKSHAPEMCVALFSTLNVVVTELPPTSRDPEASLASTIRRELLHKVRACGSRPTLILFLTP